MVSALECSGSGFEFRSDYYLDLFHGSPEFKSSATLVKSQLVCIQTVGILNNLVFNLHFFLFQLFARVTSLCAINTNEGKYRLLQHNMIQQTNSSYSYHTHHAQVVFSRRPRQSEIRCTKCHDLIYPRRLRKGNKFTFFAASLPKFNVTVKCAD